MKGIVSILCLMLMLVALTAASPPGDPPQTTEVQDEAPSKARVAATQMAAEEETAAVTEAEHAATSAIETMESDQTENLYHAAIAERGRNGPINFEETLQRRVRILEITTNPAGEGGRLAISRPLKYPLTN